jgi:hypothetical protein
MSWWLLEEEETKREYLSRVKYDEILYKRVKHFSDIIDNKFPENVQTRIITEKSFNAISVIDFLINHYKIEEVYIAIYRMNEQSVRKIIEYSEKKININIIVSSFFRNNKKYEKWAKELVLKKSETFKVAFAWNHSKVMLAKTINDKYIVFEGSGNLSDNARIEQYLIENNKQIYKFHKKWMDEILK